MTKMISYPKKHEFPSGMTSLALYLKGFDSLLDKEDLKRKYTNFSAIILSSNTASLEWDLYHLSDAEYAVINFGKDLSLYNIVLFTTSSYTKFPPVKFYYLIEDKHPSYKDVEVWAEYNNVEKISAKDLEKTLERLNTLCGRT